MLKIAHRGSSLLYGDNNMISFYEAHLNGFDVIELDVQLCSTGQIVVYHDTYINNKFIADTSFEELKLLNIPTLNDVFKAFVKTNIKLFLDIKGDHLVIYPIIDLIKKFFSYEDMNRLFISGFDRFFVDILHNADLNVHIGLTTSNSFNIEQLPFMTKHCSFVCIDWTALNHYSISILHNLNLLVFSFTCSDNFILNHMKSFQLDGIVSNFFFD